MCELLGVSCNQEVRASFSFKRLAANSKQNPHGWGLAFYPDESVQIFKEPRRADKSPLAKFIGKYDRVLSKIYISHIRQWKTKTKAYKNSHPFSREWKGRSYVFAHNGSVPNLASVLQSPFQPIGITDSEKVFCNLMAFISEENLNFEDRADLSLLEEHLRHINQSRNAKLNCLLSDGSRVLCYRDIHCHKNLYLLQRDSQAPAEGQHYEDEELSVQLHIKKSKDEKACIVATKPLTKENWSALTPGTLTVLENGEVVYPEQVDFEETNMIRAEVYDSPAWAETLTGFPNVVGMPKKLRNCLGVNLRDKVSLVHGEKLVNFNLYCSDKKLTGAASRSVADNRECHVWLPPRARENLGLEITEIREGKDSFKKKFGRVGIKIFQKHT